MSEHLKKALQLLWSVVCWLIFSGLVAAIVAALYYYQRADVKLREHAESVLRSVYPELAVQVGAAQLVQGEGIRLRPISFARPAQQDKSARIELAYIESLLLRCDTSIASLMQGSVAIEHVVCDGLALQLDLDAHGHPNLHDLIPGSLPACTSKSLPEISVVNATIKLHDDPGHDPRTLELENVQLDLHLERGASANSLDGPSEIESSAEPIAPAELPAVVATARGSFQADWCRQVKMEGVVRTTDGAWALRLAYSGLTWSDVLRRQLPHHLSQRLAMLTPLQAQLNGTLEARKATAEGPIDWSSHTTLREGEWHGDQLPQPITQIACEITLQPGEWSITQLAGRYGEAQLGPASIQGPGWPSPETWQAEFEFAQLTLTERLIEHLPEPIPTKWRTLRPEGNFSGHAEVRHDRLGYHVQTKIDCQDVALAYYKFPYPITKCQGSVTWDIDNFRFDLQGAAGSTPVSLQGDITNPGPGFTGSWEVKTLRSKPIDEDLLSAIPTNAGKIVRDLQLRGNVGFWARLERSEPDQTALPHVIVALDDGWVNYQTFPYPVSRIKGQVEWKDGLWTFGQLDGWNDGCHVVCNGSWKPRVEDRPLELTFEVDHATLDAELRQALNKSSQAVWDQLRPQGQLDRLVVKVWKTTQMPRPDLDIQIWQQPPTGDHTSPDSLQLQPRFFALPLHRVSGTARWKNQAVKLVDLVAHHGNTEFRTNGQATLKSNGGWNVQLTSLTADRIQVDGELLAALPNKLGKALQPLQLDGTFGLDGAMQFSRVDRESPVQASWDVVVSVEQGRMDCGLPVEAIFGQIAIHGVSNEERFYTRGFLQIDSLMCQRVQLTDLTSPFLVDSNRLTLGQQVPPASTDENPEPLVASVYGGKLSANVDVGLDDQREFNLKANLTNADMATMAREWQLGQGNLAGQAFLELALAGNGRGRHTWYGTGTAQLRNANLYELPLVLALINRLSSGRRDNRAFTSSDISFQVRDEYVYFDRFILSGDTLTLKGMGEMSLNRELDLDFYSIVGQEQLWSPLVRPFLGEASRQFLLIHVDGTLSQPRTRQEVLPGLSDTLQILFPELTPPPPEGRTSSSRRARSQR